MPRDQLSPTFVSTLLARESGTVVLMLVDIEHEDLETPIRIVNNTEDVVSGGNLYTAVGFEVRLPDDRDGTPRGAQLQIDNTTQWLTPTVRSLFGEFLVTIRIAIPSDAEAVPPEYDGIEMEYLPMQLTSLQMNETTVEATLSYENLANELYPPESFDPFHFRGLF
jgi:nitrogen fixation protein